MVIISKRIINEFIEQYPKSKEPLLRWYLHVKKADWQAFSTLKEDFGSVDAIGKDLYVFNIGGNKFRLIARIIFRARTVFIRFIGTHAEYDRMKISGL